jgi:hypothetical protein
MALGTSLTLESLYHPQLEWKQKVSENCVSFTIFEGLDLTNNIAKMKAQVYVNLCNMV